MIDYHTHSILSDGKNCYEEMISTAIDKGLEEIGFSDHLCLKPVSWAISRIDLPVMTEKILELREKYSDRIKIRYGIEMDYFPGREEELRELINLLPLDYVIGSIHFIGDWNFDTDKSLYGKWTNDKLYTMYFELVMEAARSGLFDIIGHIDIIKKFRVYPESDQSQLIETTLKTIKENNVAVELNTSGIDRPCADFMPGPAIVKRCYHHQIPMTISSDAHKTDHVARYFESAVDLLKETGFKELASFENRKMKMFRI